MEPAENIDIKLPSTGQCEMNKDCREVIIHHGGEQSQAKVMPCHQFLRAASNRWPGIPAEDVEQEIHADLAFHSLGREGTLDTWSLDDWQSFLEGGSQEDTDFQEIQRLRWKEEDRDALLRNAFVELDALAEAAAETCGKRPFRPQLMGPGCSTAGCTPVLGDSGESARTYHPNNCNGMQRGKAVPMASRPLSSEVAPVLSGALAAPSLSSGLEDRCSVRRRQLPACDQEAEEQARLMQVEHHARHLSYASLEQRVEELERPLPDGNIHTAALQEEYRKEGEIWIYAMEAQRRRRQLYSSWFHPMLYGAHPEGGDEKSEKPRSVFSGTSTPTSEMRGQSDPLHERPLIQEDELSAQTQQWYEPSAGTYSRGAEAASNRWPDTSRCHERAEIERGISGEAHRQHTRCYYHEGPELDEELDTKTSHRESSMDSEDAHFEGDC